MIFLPPDFDLSSIADCGESSPSPAPSTHHDVDSAGPANISVPSENAAMAVDTEPIGNPPKRLRLSLSRGTKVSVTSTNVCSASLKDSTNKPTNPKRFAKPVTSPEREKAAKGVIPETQKPVRDGPFKPSMPGHSIARFSMPARLSPMTYWRVMTLSHGLIMLSSVW